MMMDRMFFLVLLKDPNGSLRFQFKSLRLGSWQVKFTESSGYKWLPWLLEPKNLIGFRLKLGLFALKFVAQIKYVFDGNKQKVIKMCNAEN